MRRVSCALLRLFNIQYIVLHEFVTVFPVPQEYGGFAQRLLDGEATASALVIVPLGRQLAKGVEARFVLDVLGHTQGVKRSAEVGVETFRLNSAYPPLSRFLLDFSKAGNGVLVVQGDSPGSFALAVYHSDGCRAVRVDTDI